MRDKEIEIELLRKENESLKTENHNLKKLLYKDKFGNTEYKLDNGYIFHTDDPNQEKIKTIIEELNFYGKTDYKKLKVDFDIERTSWIRTLWRGLFKRKKDNTSYHPELREEDFN